VSKDKKKKDGKKGKKNGGLVSPKTAKSRKALSENPMVADVVAAALVSMAAALKDSEKARRLANDAGEQLSALSKKSSKQGNAMWDLALDVGRRALETLAGEEASSKKSARK
jgi:hypothetical protein